MNKKEKEIFIARVIGWLVFALIIPVVFIGYRFGIFDSSNSLQLSGWGIIAIVIAGVVALTIIKYIKLMFTEWSMVRQIISGVTKVLLPLGILLAVCVSLRDGLNSFILALSITLVSEAIAIPLNPFPKMIWKRTQGRYEGMIDFVVDKFYNKNKENKGE